MNKHLQPLLYRTVCALYQKRVQDHTFPYIALEKDIKTEVSAVVLEVLNDMVADGVLQCHQNVNGLRMFAPVNVADLNFNDI